MQALVDVITVWGNAALASLSVVLLGMMMSQGRSWCDVFLHHVASWQQPAWVTKMFGSEVHTICVARIVDSPMHKYRETHDNVYYQAMTWFITHTLGWDRGQLNAHRCQGEGKHLTCVVPADGNYFDFEYKRTKFFCKFYSNTRSVCSGSSGNKLTHHLSLSCRGFGAALIIEFLDGIVKQYEALQDDAEWEQTCFSVVSDDNEKQTKWVGTPTNSTKTWQGIVMNKQTKDLLMTDVKCFLESKQWYSDMGLAWTRGYMFHGPPGTGKTSSALAISQAAKIDLYNLDLKAIHSNEQLCKLVALIPSKAVIVMEDIDAMGDLVLSRHAATSDDAKGDELEKSKETHDGNLLVKMIGCSKSSLTLSGLLNALNGIVCGCGRIVVMTTNHMDKLDPALIRPGRIDMKIHLGLCSDSMLVDMYEMFFVDALENDPTLRVDLLHVSALCSELLTPAEVSCVFLTHRFDARAALSKVKHEVTIAQQRSLT